MAFIDIEDPVKREQIVQDYIKNIQEIRQRKENQKVHGMQQQQNIEKAFKPVVQATEKSATQITNEIKNLKEKAEKKEPESQALYYYFNQVGKTKLDQYYGIYEKDGIYMMGNREVKVDNHNNIHIDNIVIKGTPGLWRLIMMKKPEVFTTEEERDYKELVERTNVIDFPHQTKSTDKPKNTSKYTFLTDLLTKGTRSEQEDEEEEDEEDQDDDQEEDQEEEGDQEENQEKDGTGISFLPGDINGLINRLHLLQAEFRAGNKSATKTQIVAILDELLRRSYLNQDEYNGVCRALLC